MKNDHKQPDNGSARPTEGEMVARKTSQGEHPQIKEGDGQQGRPEYGADAGPNTSSREDQLPSLDNHTSATAEGDD